VNNVALSSPVYTRSSEDKFWFYSRFTYPNRTFTTSCSC